MRESLNDPNSPYSVSKAAPGDDDHRFALDSVPESVRNRISYRQLTSTTNMFPRRSYVPHAISPSGSLMLLDAHQECSFPGVVYTRR